MEQIKQLRTRLLLKYHEWNLTDLLKKATILLVSLFVSRLYFNETPLLLFFPLLLLSTLMGFSQLLFCSIGILIGGLTLSPNYLLYYSLAITVFLSLSIGLKFLPFSYSQRLAICLFIADLGFRALFYKINNLPLDISLLALSVLSLLLGYFAVETFDAYVSEHKSYYPPSFILFCGSFLLLAVAGLPATTGWIVDYRIITIYLGLLLLARYTGSFIGTALVILGSIISFFILGLTESQFVLMLLSLSLTALVADKGKIIMCVAYSVSAFTIATYLQLPIDTAFYLSYGIPISCFLLLPTNLVQLQAKMPNPVVMLRLQQRHFTSLQNEISNKMKAISELFHEVSLQLKDSEEVKVFKKELDIIYKNVCYNCPKNKVCYQTNTNQLVAFIQKAAQQTLDIEDERYIKTTCIKPSAYLDRLNETKNSYNNKYSQEYNLVKQMVYFQLDGVSKVLKDYAYEMQNHRKLNQNELEEIIKASLELAQVEIIYVRVVKDYLNFPFLELAVNVKSMKHLEELVPYLEERIHSNIEISSIKHNSFDNYYILSGIIKPQYQLKYGVGQLSEDKECCGDSISCFGYKNKFVLALSDGMGVGRDAKRESDATLNLLKKMLETDMDDNKAIETINTLLKLKNRIDTYATLDFLTFDKTSGQLRFIKNGAPTSYLIHDDELLPIDNYSLPIGIVSEVIPFDYKTKAEENDLIVLTSDGLIDIMGDDLPKMLLKYRNLQPQTIVNHIMAKCEEGKGKDDISIIVAKVEKSFV